MGQLTDLEELPDVFGPYFPGIKAIHNKILNRIKEIPGVQAETEMHTLQCNFREYILEDHDKNYKWKEAHFDNDKNRTLAIGINRSRILSNIENENALIKEIQNIWKKHGKLTILREITEVAELKKDDWEMILSVHFWFDKKYRTDNIDDTQYCKIVYTKFSLNEYLERIRLTLPST